MTPQREKRFREVASRRQANLAVILENVHDPHNIGAVLRTCESVGVMEVYILYNDPQLQGKRIHLGHKTSSGSRKWLEVYKYENTQKCFEAVQRKYDKIFATHLDKQAVSLHDLELTSSVALLFGNEKDGLTEEALSYANGNFIIPQMGFVQSLNISVACAITLYEALRQRQTKGFYTQNPTLSRQKQEALYLEYKRRHDDGESRKYAIDIS